MGAGKTTVARTRPGRAFLCLAAFSLMAAGCATLSPEEEQEIQRELDAAAETSIRVLLDSQSDAGDVFARSAGYAVADMSLAKIPVFGTGSGYAVVVDKSTGDRIYLKVSQFEVGGGLGAQKYKAVILFTDEDVLDRAMTGFWHFDAGVAASAGESNTAGSASTGKGYTAYRIAENGVVATLTVRAVRAKPM